MAIEDSIGRAPAAPPPEDRLTPAQAEAQSSFEQRYRGNIGAAQGSPRYDNASHLDIPPIETAYQRQAALQSSFEPLTLTTTTTTTLTGARLPYDRLDSPSTTFLEQRAQLNFLSTYGRVEAPRSSTYLLQPAEFCSTPTLYRPRPAEPCRPFTLPPPCDSDGSLLVSVALKNLNILFSIGGESQRPTICNPWDLPRSSPYDWNRNNTSDNSNRDICDPYRNHTSDNYGSYRHSSGGGGGSSVRVGFGVPGLDFVFQSSSDQNRRDNDYHPHRNIPNFNHNTYQRHVGSQNTTDRQYRAPQPTTDNSQRNSGNTKIKSSGGKGDDIVATNTGSGAITVNKITNIYNTEKKTVINRTENSNNKIETNTKKEVHQPQPTREQAPQRHEPTAQAKRPEPRQEVPQRHEPTPQPKRPEQRRETPQRHEPAPQPQRPEQRRETPQRNEPTPQRREPAPQRRESAPQPHKQEQQKSGSSNKRK